nr:winged helix-turn-helix domain-containing protein [Qipengyuania xiamenensis]
MQPHRQLLLDGEHVHLGPRALSILTVLAEAGGEIVTKDELMQAVWQDVTVEENALQVHVTAVRKALGDDAGRLHTLRGIGYSLETAENPEQNGEILSTSVGEEAASSGNAAISSPRSNPWRNWVIASLAAVGLVLLTLGAFWILAPSDPITAGERAPTTLAVLPFEVTGDEEWQKRGETLNASLSSNLTRVPDIEFVSVFAARAVADDDLSPSAIGARLGVDHFIEGDVQATGDRLTGLVRLVEVSSGRPIWSGEIEGDKRYPDEFEALLLNRISGVLIALRKIAQGDVEIPQDLDPRAYEAFLDGMARLTVTTWEDHWDGFRQMKLAASIEPDFAAAHAGISLTLSLGSNATFNTMSREEFLAQHEASIAKALEIDPDNFMAQLAEAFAKLGAHGDIPFALEKADELLERRPNDGHAHQLKAYALNMAGQTREAMTHLDRAMDADPFNYWLHVYRRGNLISLNDYAGVKRSALSCRVHCWRAANQWWAALLKIGSRNDYENDIETMAAMYDDDRAYYSGEAGRAQSLRSHAEFIFLDRPNPYMRDYDIDEGSGWGINDWNLLLFRYGYVDAAFDLAMEKVEVAPVGHIGFWLNGGRLAPSEEIRADPRYHAIFEIPRFKAVADYRRERGITDGLPFFPVRPYEAN